MVNVAIVGSGNIGTDLLLKIKNNSSDLRVAAMVGIDPESDGLARAARLGVKAIPTGIHGLLADHDFTGIGIVFDATSASAHVANNASLAGTHVKIVDLTPAAIGPYVVPPVNLDRHLGERNVNMVTCGGQATIPIVAAISAVTRVQYAEIVASIASRSAGPGTRANIDEFTHTTSRAIEQVGGADRGKAIIVLNPAEPPMIMRDTVSVIADDTDPGEVTDAIHAMVERVQEYVPGYRLKQDVQVRRLTPSSNENDLVAEPASVDRLLFTTYLEVEGAGHYLPSYAGNLDIMTSAAVRVGEELARAGKR